MLALAALLVAACTPQPERREVFVFAAASLRDVLGELAVPFERETGIRPVFNFAGSNVLALQIEAASGADVFLSAHERWMSYLEERGRLEDGSRRPFLSNRLVVVVHRDSPIRELRPAELAGAGYRFLSLADPDAVPAGQYARRFLERETAGDSDLWRQVRDRVAPAPDVRAALALVESEPDVVGIVYASDARSSERVRVVYTVPAERSPQIRYSAALVRGGDAGRDAGRLFVDFLARDESGSLFAQYGFVPMP